MTSSSSEETPSKGRKIVQKSKALVKNLRPAQLVAPLVTLGLGYRIGVKRAALTAGESATKTAADAAQKTLVGRAKEWPIVSAILLAVALREVWQLTPRWLKRNIPYIGRKISSSTDQEDPNDLTSVASLAAKLKSLNESAQSKMKSQEALATSDTQVAFFALLQLVGQFKDRFSKRRDERYKSAGNELDATELEGFDEYFELADWAYNEFEEDESLSKALAMLDYTLVRHDETMLPGFVAHYIALNKKKKQVLIAVKGTSSLEDMLTDCCGQAVEYELKNGPFMENGSTKIHCHEGILLAAEKLFRDVETIVEELFLPNYQIVITGHSLGAGVGALLGIMLRSRFEELRSDPGKRLKVLAFASPPVVDYEASLACESFCTTIVNNSDIIPRSSLSNLVVMMEFLKILNKKLEEKGKKPKNLKSAGRFMKMLMSSEGDMVMSADEIKEGMEDAFEKVDLKDPDHLYVAGQVYHMYDLWSKEGYDDVEEAVEKEASDEAKEDIDQAEAEKDLLSVRTAEKAYAGHGASSVLRFIELDSRMLTDHLSPAYRSSLRAILSSVDKRSEKVAAYNSGN